MRLTEEQLIWVRSRAVDTPDGPEIAALVDEVRERRAADLDRATWAILGDALDGIEPGDAAYEEAQRRLDALASLAGLTIPPR